MPAHMQMITKSMVAPAAERAAEAEYEADLKSDFVTTLPAALAYLRQRLQEFTKNESDTTSLRWAEDRSAILFDMYRKMHGISAGAGAAGCARIARLSLAFEALLTEMSEDQDKINPSTVRTVAHTVDFLATVFDRAMDSEGNKFMKVNILVVDDEPLSRKAVMRGLEKADLTAKDVADPHVAAELAGNESFNLVFLDIDMPGMDGYELCKRVRETPGNKKTPVIFVTGLTDFMTKAKSSLSGGNDLIGKPFLPVELAIKALTYLLKSRFD
jgi:CheY-like chemotaxis protein